MTGFTGHTWSSARRNAPGWDEHRKAKLTEMWNRGDRVADIADALSTSRGGIYVQANKMGLRRRAERAGRPRTSAKVHHRNDQGARRHLSYEAKGVSRVVLQPHHPASREGSTIFPGSVIPAGFSGLRMEQDGAIVVDRLEEAIGILCPAERDQNRCCGSCGLCWHTNKTISFLRH